jgi:hypothetical protein
MDCVRFKTSSNFLYCSSNVNMGFS